MQSVKIIQSALVNGTRLALEHLEDMPPIQKEIYAILASEIEEKRSILRDKNPPFPIEGLLGPKEIDFYGNMYWADIFISNPDILEKVRDRSKYSYTQIFEAIDALQPTNWRAIFWMKQYIDLLDKHTGLKIVTPYLIKKISESQEADFRKSVSDHRRMSAKKGHASSEKGQAKIAIKEEWLKWKKTRGDGRWRAKFARAMLDKYSSITNQKSIENWAKTWDDEYKK